MVKSFVESKTRKLATCCALAAVLGIATGAVNVPGHAKVVRATSHCTHYTPPYAQDTSGGCSEVYTVDPGWYETLYTALRDSNTAAMAYNATVCVQYDNESSAHCNNVSSTEASEGSSGGAATAGCSTSNTNLGVCETNWHS